MGLIRPTQKPRRDVPALTVVGDDGDGLPIVASQHAHDAAVSVRLKGDAIADLELEHLGTRPHLELLVARLQSVARHVIVLRGGMSPTERRAAAAMLASIPDGESRLLIATSRYIGEEFDDARLDTLFLAMPVSWKGTLVQYAGRLHRLHPRKTEVRIYDYVDHDVPMLARMFKKRLRGYRAIGYDRDSGTPPRRELDDALETLDLAEDPDGDG